MDTILALKQTHKGRLTYDKFWDTNVKAMLDECTSPPHIFSVVHKVPDNQSDDSNFSQSGGEILLVTPSKVSRTVTYDVTYDACDTCLVSPARPSRKVTLGKDNTLKIVRKVDPVRISLEPVRTSSNDRTVTSADICYVTSVKSNKNNNQVSHSDRDKDAENIVVTPINSSTDSSLNLSSVAATLEDLIPSRGQIQFSLQEYDSDLKKKIQNCVLKRWEKQEQAGKMLQADVELKLNELNMSQEIEYRQQLEQLKAATKTRTLEAQERQQQLKEDHKRHAKLLNAKLQAAEEKKQQIELEQKRLVEEETRKIQEQYNRFLDVTKNVVVLFNNCQHKEHLPDDNNKHMSFLNDVKKQFQALMSRQSDPAELSSKYKKATDYVSQSLLVLEYMQKAVVVANKKVEEELLAQQRQIESQRQKTEKSTVTLPAKQDEGVTATASGDEILCIQPEAFETYTKLMDNMKAVQENIQELVTNVSLKKTKFELQKAVNLSVNTISSQSGAHLREKLTKLHRLLLGQTIDKQVSAKSHPAGIDFCKDLLAKKIVQQGEEQVSSNYESAFAIAAVAVGVWCEFPDFGNLLIGHFYKKCPYLVPYYIPMEGGQSPEEHYMQLGYIYKDGECEKQDKFLRRMSGLVRLYASMMLCTPPRGRQHPHPHGLIHAWEWMASILNIEPRPDITATILYDFLSVTGHSMERTYRKQFHKMLHLLITEYMPKIRQVTPSGSGGPVTRLETFIQTCIKNIRNIPQPEGLLSPNFWYER